MNVFIFLWTNSTLAHNSDRVFVNKWAVEIEGGSLVANEVAEAHGFINEGQVKLPADFFFNCYSFSCNVKVISSIMQTYKPALNANIFPCASIHKAIKT